MKTSDKGLSLIKGFEGFRGRAYKCPAGVWTIGYGHTGLEVKSGSVITEWQGGELLKKDIARFERAIDNLVKVPLNQNQFDALVSFVFNVGEVAFSKSTLLKLLNAKDYTGAAAQFPRWNKGGGKVLPGLVKRRAAERKLFESKP